MIFKLIQINPGPSYERQFYPEDHVHFYQWGMGNLLNLQLKVKFKDMEYENWRLDLNLKSIKSEIIDGIKCLVFPAQRFLFFQQFSLSLIKAVYSEYKESRRSKIPIVIHFHGMHHLFFSLISFLFPKVPFIVSHHGGCNFSYKRIFLQKSAFKKAGSLVAEWIDRLGLKNVCAAIPQTEYQEAYLKSLGFKMNIVRMPVAGLDASRLKIMARKEAREILDLPQDKKIILQVGRAHYNRGVDRFIELYEKNKEDQRLYFITVDAQVGDELYAKIMDSGIAHRGWIEPDKLYLYLNAADVLLYLPGGEMDLKFAGTSFLPLEALACGTPVIATTLIHFPVKEIVNYARIPGPKDDLQPIVEEMIATEMERNAARDLVLKYYNWDNLIERYRALYENCLLADA